GVTPDVALGGLPTSLTEGVDLGALSRWPLPEEEGRQAHDAADLLLLEDGHCLRDQALNVCHKADARQLRRFGASSLATLAQL
ncbi:hypothetical protein NL473_28955, partial [Klebsiella pneumoniae]|nr:hypothetical protein [Klebsiella pneumoniae]MCP6594656.1 hypothetical protein [Klebsiella pneumoniae]